MYNKMPDNRSLPGCMVDEIFRFDQVIRNFVPE